MRSLEVGMSTKMKRTTIAALALVLASTIGVNAEPRGGGGGFGGRMGGGFGGEHVGRGFDGHGFGGPRIFVGGGFYDPYWYPYGLFPFAYYPYAAYAYGLSLDSNVKVKVTPKDAQVFVDGYYAGVADKFGGAFHRLHVMPGGHVITIYRDGFRTLSRSIYARPGSGVTFDGQLQPLGPGEVSTPPAPPASPTIPPVEPQAPPTQPGQ